MDELRIQLDEDATTRTGGYSIFIVRATKEMGYVQPYNTTDNPLNYEIKTNHAQPTILINYNDNPFWRTFKFDFVNKQGTAVSDSSDYQESDMGYLISSSYLMSSSSFPSDGH